LQSFEAGSWVWVPDEKEMFLPGKVVKSFKPGEDGQIKYEDGKVRRHDGGRAGVHMQVAVQARPAAAGAGTDAPRPPRRLRRSPFAAAGGSRRAR
jgi:hypothetical protein